MTGVFSLHRKRTVSRFMLAMLFFGQLVLVVQGCLASDDLAPFAPRNTHSMMMGDARMAPTMPDCDKTKTANPNLCLAALTQSDQAVSHHDGLSVPALVPVAVSLLPVDVDSPRARHPRVAIDIRPYPRPPASILFCSFQI